MQDWKSVVGMWDTWKRPWEKLRVVSDLHQPTASPAPTMDHFQSWPHLQPGHTSSLARAPFPWGALLQPGPTFAMTWLMVWPTLQVWPHSCLATPPKTWLTHTVLSVVDPPGFPKQRAFHSPLPKQMKPVQAVFLHFNHSHLLLTFYCGWDRWTHSWTNRGLMRPALQVAWAQGTHQRKRWTKVTEVTAW